MTEENMFLEGYEYYLKIINITHWDQTVSPVYDHSVDDRMMWSGVIKHLRLPDRETGVHSKKKVLKSHFDDFNHVLIGHIQELKKILGRCSRVPLVDKM